MSLLPIALVVIIGLVFGIILTFAAKIMYVPVDEIVAEVREALPGANCGACGYSGCDGYAAAFGEDRSTPVNKCICRDFRCSYCCGKMSGKQRSHK